MNEKYPKHEKPTSAKVVSGLSGIALMLSGCSTIERNDTIAKCDADVTPVIATFPGANTYTEEMDPVIIARFVEEKAREVHENDSFWTFQMRNQVIGLGEIVCQSEVDESVYHLTPKGAAARQDMLESGRFSE